MIVAGFIISFLMGLLILRLVSDNDQTTWEDIFLAWGIGAGCCAQLTFYSILPWMRLIPPFTGVIIITAVLLLWKKARHHLKPFDLSAKTIPEIFFIGLLLFVAILLSYQSIHLPYGGYDAWSLWNYRAQTVFNSDPHWTGIFHNEIQGKHPWLLPFFVVHSWVFAGHQTILGPLMIALATSIATIGLLTCALAEDIGWVKALLGGLFLFFIPYFGWHSINQYACILVAYYTLAACICLKKATLDIYNKKYWILSALFLGFLAFTKDEGMVLAAAILISCLIFLRPKNIFQNKTFWTTLFMTLPALILVEIFMRTNILTSAPLIKSDMYYTNGAQIFDLSRWQAIQSFFIHKVLSHAQFGRMHLWLPLLLLGIFSRTGRFLLATLTIYGIVFFILYLVVTNNMVWRMDVTMSRLLFQILPLAVFTIFHTLFAIKNQDTSD